MPSDILLSLVIPTFNESGNIEPLIVELCSILDREIARRYELIVVDDDSPDRTWELAEKIGVRLEQVRVLRRQSARGLSSAVVAGWKIARGEIWGVIDADLQHPPPVIAPLLAAMQAGADLALGTRHLPGGGVSDWKWSRRALSRGAQALAFILVPEARKVTDPMSGLFLVRASALDLTRINPLGYKILLDVLATGRFREIKEVPYVFRERVIGGSKVTLRQYGEFILQIVGLRFSRRNKLPPLS
ncbi:MAG: polyprenol monophosphomannose synthase [Chthoniobacterales bacterium]|nr:polyprenol monophosphomannose synthase [Chthoniobacterales bacterium]